MTDRDRNGETLRERDTETNGQRQTNRQTDRLRERPCGKEFSVQKKILNSLLVL